MNKDEALATLINHLHTDGNAVAIFVMENNPQDFYKSLKKFLSDNPSLGKDYPNKLKAALHITPNDIKDMHFVWHSLIDTHSLTEQQAEEIICRVPFNTAAINWTMKPAIWEGLGLEVGDFKGLISQNLELKQYYV